MVRPKRSVELEYDEEKARWRASLAVYGPKRKNLLGYGTNIAAALVALSRTVERFAVEQFNALLQQSVPVPVAPTELTASAPKLCGACGLVEGDAGGLCEPCRLVEDAEVGGGG